MLVMDKADALNSLNEKNAAKQQELLNYSEIYLDGKPLGLALGRRDPFDAEALEHSVRSHSSPAAVVEATAQTAAPRQESAPVAQSRPVIVDSPGKQLPESQASPKVPPSQDTPGRPDATPRSDLGGREA